jgi:hypothetical protein
MWPLYSLSFLKHVGHDTGCSILKEASIKRPGWRDDDSSDLALEIIISPRPVQFRGRK